MGDLKFYFSFLVSLFFYCSSPNLYAQKNESYRANLATYKNLASVLKKSKPYPIDTAIAGFGNYDKIISPFFDKDAFIKRIKKDPFSEMSENGVFMLQQMYIGALNAYLKKIPAKNLQIIPLTRSYSLDSNWRKNSTEEETVDIENSLLLICKDKERQINLINLVFNPINNKVIYLEIFGYLKDENEYLEKIMNKK